MTLDYTLPSQQWLLIDKKFWHDIKVETLLSKSYFDEDLAFLGYEHISSSYADLQERLKQDSWQHHLSTIYGIFLITDRKTGKAYVGSVYGNSGVYGCWATYMSSGYDKEERENSTYPNNQLRQLAKTQRLAYIQENFQHAL